MFTKTPKKIDQKSFAFSWNDRSIYWWSLVTDSNPSGDQNLFRSIPWKKFWLLMGFEPAEAFVILRMNVLIRSVRSFSILFRQKRKKTGLKWNCFVFCVLYKILGRYFRDSIQMTSPNLFSSFAIYFYLCRSNQNS